MTLSVDGVQVEQRDITLVPGEKGREEKFTFDAPDVIGQHELEIAGVARPFEVIPLVVILPAALNLVAPLIISPEEVQRGDQVTITFTIRNDGEETGETDVLLKIRDEEVERRTVSVPGQESVTEAFTVRRDEEGGYSVEVEAPGAKVIRKLEGAFTVVTPVALITLEALRVEPGSVTSGEPVTISVDVINKGDGAGSRTVALIVDGKQIEERELYLEPGETVTVTFTHVEEAVGTHTVEVEGIPGQFEVTEVPAAPAAFPIMLIIIVVIVVVVVAAAGILFYMRKVRGGGTQQAA